MIFSESEPAVAFGYGEASGRFEKIPALRAFCAYCRATRLQVSAVNPSAKLIDSFLLPIYASAKENLAYLAP